MKSQLFIASKVKVGFNLRSDTYTGRLGYVIGFDGKNGEKNHHGMGGDFILKVVQKWMH